MRTVYSSKHNLRAASELVGGQMVPSYECPERAEIIINRVREIDLGNVVSPQNFGLGSTLAIHDSAYIEFLQHCWDEWKAQDNKGELLPLIWPGRSMPSTRIPEHIDGKAGYYCLSVDTTITADTWEAVRLSADVALSAALHVKKGDASAFALCRPPGHHATADAYGGYCFINNAAVSAQWLLDNGSATVAILDVDFHHGNGTQSIFYDRADVLVQSIHGEPAHCFPHFSGYKDETGKAQGEGFNINYPLAPQTSYKTWQLALDRALEKISSYAPDVLVVSLGVDTYEDDPISSFKLKSADFSSYGALIAQLDLPTIFVMEGGYAVAEIGINTVNVLTAFEQAHRYMGQQKYRSSIKLYSEIG